MEDKRKLTAAIIGAITAYIQTEQPPPPITPRVKPKTRANGWKISPKQGATKAKRVRR